MWRLTVIVCSMLCSMHGAAEAATPIVNYSGYTFTWTGTAVGSSERTSFSSDGNLLEYVQQDVNTTFIASVTPFFSGSDADFDYVVSALSNSFNQIGYQSYGFISVGSDYIPNDYFSVDYNSGVPDFRASFRASFSSETGYYNGNGGVSSDDGYADANSYAINVADSISTSYRSYYFLKTTDFTVTGPTNSGDGTGGGTGTGDGPGGDGPGGGTGGGTGPGDTVIVPGGTRENPAPLGTNSPVSSIRDTIAETGPTEKFFSFMWDGQNVLESTFSVAFASGLQSNESLYTIQLLDGNGTAVPLFNSSGSDVFDGLLNVENDFMRSFRAGGNMANGYVCDFANSPCNLAAGNYTIGLFGNTSIDPELTISFASPVYAVTNAAVPEPATWAMLILGFGVVGGSMRRRRSHAAIA